MQDFTINSHASIWQLLLRLLGHINPRRKVQFGILLLLMLITAFAEMFSIGAVVPFLAVLTDPEPVFHHPLVQPVIGLLDLTTPQQLLLPLTILFGFGAIVSGCMRLLLLWFATTISYAAGADLGISIYERTLYQSYAVHVSRNSSSVIAGISTKANMVIGGVITPLLTLMSSGVILTVVVIGLLSFDPIIALSAFGGFGLIYLAIIRLTRGQMQKNSESIARESSEVVKALQEGLGGIRDVLIDGTQGVYCRVFRSADVAMKRALGSNQFIGQSPRFIMEAMGMLLISMLAFAMAQKTTGVAKAIPVLGALALGAQRMLPVLQQAYASWSGIVGSQTSLLDTLELLDQPLPAHAHESFPEPISFAESIRLTDLSFRYAYEAPWVLQDINLSIPKGARVGIIGSTGSGKSTLLDIVMGLLCPTHGEIRVDGEPITENNARAWQAHIAHVPQTIFLADSSIEENIAFGVRPSDIDHERVRMAARWAQIAGAIESWPKQYKTFVGERGIKLSGGQRQRIGIARALYKMADVIIFDEATSALDSNTEEAVMHAIENLHADLTVLIIAHRLSTLKNCDTLVELEFGRIKRVGSYKTIVG